MNEAQQANVNEAAKTIFDSLSTESFTPGEKIATVKELSRLIRNEID